MSKAEANQGVIVTGHGQITADQMAVGRGARAIKYIAAADASLESKGLTELRARLDELAQAVADHAAALPDHEDVVIATEGIATQLSADKPNKFVLTTLLDGLAAKVQSVTKLALAVEALRTAVGVFI